MIDPNSKIGVFAPSSYVDASDIEAAGAAMVARGFEVFVHPQVFAREHQSAGSHADKAQALHDLYRDSSVDVIWAAGGGNRALHIIDMLDYDLIRANAKPMIGFSDVTALINATSVRSGVVNVHGPVFKNLAAYSEMDILLELLLGGEFSMPLDACTVIQSGMAEGQIFGGNLSIFQYLPEVLGIDFLDDAILILEDCNEELSRIDRMFLHLNRLGVFDRVSAVILGGFSNLADSARPFGYSFEDVAREHLGGLDIPVIMHAPFGHGARLHPLPIGGMAKLDENILRIKP